MPCLAVLFLCIFLSVSASKDVEPAHKLNAYTPSPWLTLRDYWVVCCSKEILPYCPKIIIIHNERTSDCLYVFNLNSTLEPMPNTSLVNTSILCAHQHQPSWLVILCPATCGHKSSTLAFSDHLACNNPMWSSLMPPPLPLHGYSIIVSKSNLTQV